MDGLIDEITKPLKDGVTARFSETYGQDGDMTYAQIRSLLIEKAKDWGNGPDGFVSLIKGYAAEQHFIDTWGNHAELASSATQKGWDVFINDDQNQQYIQVKLYNNAAPIIREIRKLQEKVNLGEVEGVNGETVSQINWAIPESLVREVQEKLESMDIEGIDAIKIYGSSPLM